MKTWKEALKETLFPFYIIGGLLGICSITCLLYNYVSVIAAGIFFLSVVFILALLGNKYDNGMY
jgi:hypothetical protein